MKSKNYTWKKQTLHPDIKHVEWRKFDPYADYEPDPSGCYVLIRIDAETGFIECAMCNENHAITHTFRGKKCQDLYHAIFEYEKMHDLSWFESKAHIAYLGKELKKAELALLSGERYIQE